MIKVYCNGTRIQCLRQGELNVGMVGAPVEFDFSSEWDGLGKTAVFRCDGERDMIIGADGKTTVPHEILTTPGMDVEVGVYAVKEDGTTWPAPTTYCKIGRVGKGADPSGDESYPPTPAVGEQAVAAASKALEAAADIQRRADAGEFDGAPGYTPVKGEDYFDGNDYVLTEADKVEIAEIAADLVDVPESGGSADLTGYATEEWVEKGYQPKGDYATKDEIPPVPTKLSAFTNDAGFVTEDALKNVGGKAYVQDTEPAQMEVGEFWYNPDEEGGTIPTTLPNPHKLTFSGAVAAEYDGSKAVEVVIPQGGGGSGGGEDWRIVKSIKLTEDVQNIIIDTDNSGNPFSLKKFIIWGYTKGTASGGQLRINAATETDSAYSYFGAWLANFKGLDTTTRRWRFACSRGSVVGDHAKWYAEYATPDSGATMQALYATNWFHEPKDDNGNKILTATFINILSNTSTVQFAAGSEIELWGVDA